MSDSLAMCECGCGLPAPRATRCRPAAGIRAGDQLRYRKGHNRRAQHPGYVVADCGHHSPCWLWQGHIGQLGYGWIKRGPVHRVYFEQARGPVPDGMELDHLCRVRHCVNPDHLEVVTRSENVRRARAADARRRPPEAETIRAARIAAKLTQRALGDRIGLPQQTVAKWEVGRALPAGAELRALRAALDPLLLPEAVA
jgi:DNA-binding transcriptional regulator YiaG